MLRRVAATALVAIVAIVAVLPTPAVQAAASVSSGQAEAKEAARSGNCTPTKVTVVRYGVGREPETVFQISCSEDKNASVLVQCRGRLCTLMR